MRKEKEKKRREEIRWADSGHSRDPCEKESPPRRTCRDRLGESGTLQESLHPSPCRVFDDRNLLRVQVHRSRRIHVPSIESRWVRYNAAGTFRRCRAVESCGGNRSERERLVARFGVLPAALTHNNHGDCLNTTTLIVNLHDGDKVFICREFERN